MKKSTFRVILRFFGKQII